MNDNRLNMTGLTYYHGRLEQLFGTKDEVDAVDTKVDTLSDRVDDIIAEGGEPNVLETVKVNNTTLPITDKAVNIDLSGYAETSDVPTKTSDLTNDGDGTSNFATESYVDTNGGKIDKIKVNNVEQTMTNKTVNIDLSNYAETSDLPTKTSDLTNDSNFQTDQDVQDAIDDALADITGIDFEVVQTLPATGEKGIIYLVSNGGSGGNSYDEYIYVNNAFEKIGTTDIDLSDYWNSTNLVAITTAQIDTLFS